MLPESTSSPHGGRSLQRLRVRRLELIGRYPSANRSFHERGGHMGPRAGPDRLRPKAYRPGASTVGSAPWMCRAPQDCAGPRCLNSAAWSFTKSRMFVGASPVSLHMVSVMRS
jgi:hypothetical protein